MSYYCNCDKVVFSGSLSATQAVTQGLPVNFSKNLSANVAYTDSSVTIKRPGLYKISVDASASTTASTATNVVMSLDRNGTQVANVQSTATSASATDFVNLSFDAVVKVMPTCCPLSDNSATFTVINSGAAANYSNLTITITRV